jgi:hypothetical protein
MIYMHVLVTSGLVGGQRSASRPGLLTPDSHHKQPLLWVSDYSYFATEPEVPSPIPGATRFSV